MKKYAFKKNRVGQNSSLIFQAGFIASIFSDYLVMATADKRVPRNGWRKQQFECLKIRPSINSMEFQNVDWRILSTWNSDMLGRVLAVDEKCDLPEVT